jgi:competence protein ComEA
VFEQSGASRLFPWIAAALLLLAIGYRVMTGGQPDAPPVSVEEPAVAQSAERHAGERGARGRRVYVHVAGAVRRPGLYRLPDGARVAVALRLAGGPTGKAELTTTNLAAQVRDGQQIVVPVRGAAPVAAGGGAPAAPGAAGPISLASATQAQLEELDGIGPTLAARIIEYRDANGGFRSVEQLGEVDGIGEVRLEALRQAVQP